MPARGLQGNPWLIKQIIELLNTGSVITKPSMEEKKEMAYRHAEMLVEKYGEYNGIRQSRSHLLWYMRGFKDAAKIRGKMGTVENLEQVKQRLNEI